MDVDSRSEGGPLPGPGSSGLPGRLILLTGERGAGKTTACVRLVETGRDRGLDCAGLLSPAVFDGQTKTGIDVLDIRSGERRRLASVVDAAGDLPRDVRRGPFRFDPDAMAWAAERLERACPCDLLVVDELGPLEIDEGRGWANALDVLRRGDFGLAVIVVRPSLVGAVRVLLARQSAAILDCSADGAARLPDHLEPAAQPGHPASRRTAPPLAD